MPRYYEGVNSDQKVKTIFTHLFVENRTAQKKAGDAKKGKQRSKGKKPTYTKTGA